MVNLRLYRKYTSINITDVYFRLSITLSISLISYTESSYNTVGHTVGKISRFRGICHFISSLKFSVLQKISNISENMESSNVEYAAFTRADLILPSNVWFY